jgi:hypothetical protein
MRTLSPVASVTPSTVEPFANEVVRVPDVVVAATTLFLIDNPWIEASQYAFVTASVAFTGVGTVTVELNVDVPVTARFVPTESPLAIPAPPATISAPVVLDDVSVVEAHESVVSV